MNLRSSMIYAITNEFTNECEKQISSFLPIALFIQSFIYYVPKFIPRISPLAFITSPP